MKIEINNLTTLVVDEGFLIDVAKKVLIGENRKDAELSIALVGQGRIRELNRKYRGKNRVTDVLSFTWPSDSEDRRKKRSKASATAGNGVGELVICLREVKKNARRYKVAFQEELAKVIIHGVLHLLGQEHEKSKTKADAMRKKEEHYLSLWRGRA